MLLDELTYSRSFVRAQIVQDHDLPRCQTGQQDLLEVDLKGRRIGRSFQKHRGSHALHRQRGEQGRVLATVARHAAVCSLSSWSSGIPWSQPDIGATFIDKHEPLGIQWLHLLPKARSLFFAAFTGCQCFFFRVQPRRLMARLMVALLTRTPYVCSHSRQRSSNRTSSWACSCVTSPSSKGANFLHGRAGIALGATPAVSRRALTS